MHVGTLLKHYKRKDIQQEIIKHVRDREIAARFNNQFGKRPEILQYEGDILEFAKQGATSFHASEERWTNPLQLSPEMSPRDLNTLRSGWDLVLDIDCKQWEHSKLVTHLLVQLIKSFGIKSVSVKFSGNKGFHIGIPFEAFPLKVHNVDTKDLFPDGPRKIAFYLIDRLERKLPEHTEKTFPLIEACKKCGAKKKLKVEYEFLCPSCDYRHKSDISYMTCPKCKRFMVRQQLGTNSCLQCGNAEFQKKADLSELLEIDTILISSRHLYRAPYSLHEKSSLVSIPIDPNHVMDFDKNEAKPENVDTKYSFLSRNANPNEANYLFIQAFDFAPQKEEPKRKTFDQPTTAIPEQFFPPCIQHISKGLEDGRKRAIFILINFLKTAGWSHDKIEQYIKDWNKRNPQPLRENYVLGQVRYAKGKKPIPPPNCANQMYMVGIGACKPDNFCQRIKNPAQYAKRKARQP